MAEQNIDSFSTFLGTIDPDFSTEEVKRSPGALEKVELKVLGAVADHDGSVKSDALATQVDLGLVELAKVLASLEAKKLVSVRGKGVAETVYLVGDVGSI